MFDISQLAQVACKFFEKERISVIKRRDKSIKLKIPKLVLDSIHVAGFSDASFASNHDLSTQLGYKAMVVDNRYNAVVTHFKWYKSERVVRSVMASEFITGNIGSDAKLPIFPMN